MARFSFGPTPIGNDPSDPGRRRWMAIGGACCLAALWPPGKAAAQSPEVARHLELAAQAAGSDLLTYLKLGDPARPGYKSTRPSIRELMEMPAPPPGKAFDNLYFVGSKWVSAWAVTTSDGILLIDAMDNEDEAERIVDKGMRTLGLDPQRIKMVVVTHGHGDHYGGAGYFKTKYGSRIAMSGVDWTMTETKLEFDTPLWGRPPVRDVILDGREPIRLGDTTLEVIRTPGHTMGTLSLVFPVKLESQSHLVLLWGGTAFNFGRQVARMQTYIESVERMREIARQKEVDVLVSNHNSYDEAVTKLAAIEAGKPNPFVLGQQTVQRALTVVSECAKANLASWEAAST